MKSAPKMGSSSKYTQQVDSDSERQSLQILPDMKNLAYNVQHTC